MMAWPLAFLGSLLLFLAGLWFALRPEQMRAQPPKQYSVFDKLQRLAKSARGAEPSNVGLLIAELPTGTGLTLSDGIKERLLPAELAFRREARDWMTFATIARAVNDLVAELGWPVYVHTNENQVGLVTDMTAQNVPDLLYPGGTRGQDKVLSPAGGVFVATVLIAQKVSGPLGRVAPDEWVQMIREQGYQAAFEHAAGLSTQYSLFVREVPPDEASARQDIQADFASPQRAAAFIAAFNL